MIKKTRRNRKVTRKLRGGVKPGQGQGKGKQAFAAKSAAKAIEAAEIAAVAEAVASIQRVAAEAAAVAISEGKPAKGQKHAAAEAVHRVLGDLIRTGASDSVRKEAEKAGEAAIAAAERGNLTGKQFVALQQTQVQKALIAQEKSKGLGARNAMNEARAAGFEANMASKVKF